LDSGDCRAAIRLCAILGVAAGSAATLSGQFDRSGNLCDWLHSASWGFAAAIRCCRPRNPLEPGQLIESLRPGNLGSGLLVERVCGRSALQLIAAARTTSWLRPLSLICQLRLYFQNR